MGLFFVLVLTVFGSTFSVQKQYDKCKEADFKIEKCEFAKKLNKLGEKK